MDNKRFGGYKHIIDTRNKDTTLKLKEEKKINA